MAQNCNIHPVCAPSGPLLPNGAYSATTIPYLDTFLLIGGRVKVPDENFQDVLMGQPSDEVLEFRESGWIIRKERLPVPRERSIVIEIPDNVRCG